ncbi:MAG: rod shape-determining protein MreC [Oscillospiraceae bacterium]|jgi:rod shape-determining protein MreC|nr:rod shape-determining protein MreC [Oscillospiraceae bacterium]
MKRFKLTKKKITVIAVAVLLAIISAVSIGAGKGGGPVGGFLSDVSTLWKRPIASIARFVESVYGYTFEYETLQREKQELEAQLRQYEQESLNYTDIMYENEQFRNLLDLKQRHADFHWDTGRILTWSASSWSKTFTVSRGTQYSDIAQGNAIVSTTGDLVGIVDSVNTTTSSCTSIIDTTFSAGVYVGDQKIAALVQGNFDLAQQGKLMIPYLEEATPIRNGDVVMTSGAAGVLPEGLVIGYVEAVVANKSGLGMYAIVTPKAMLGNAMDINIITDYQK